MTQIKVGFDKDYLKRKFQDFTDEELEFEIAQIDKEILSIKRYRLEMVREQERRKETLCQKKPLSNY